MSSIILENPTTAVPGDHLEEHRPEQAEQSAAKLFGGLVLSNTDNTLSDLGTVIDLVQQWSDFQG